MQRTSGKIMGMVLILIFAGVTTGYAQDHGKVDIEAAELQVARLIGMPVFAGGDEVGVVAEVLMGQEGRVDTIHVRTASPLGFGERLVEIPVPAFTVLRGAIVLDLTAEDVDNLPAAPIQKNDDDAGTTILEKK